MIFIKFDDNNVVDFVHSMPFDEKYGLGKTKIELESEGFLVESLPSIQEVNGKIGRYVLDPDTKNILIEYIDRELTEQEKILQLQEQNAQMLLALVDGGLM